MAGRHHANMDRGMEGGHGRTTTATATTAAGGLVSRALDAVKVTNEIT